MAIVIGSNLTQSKWVAVVHIDKNPWIALWMLGKIITITQTGIQQRVHDCGIKLGKLLKLRAVIYIRLTV